jgi:hypothetical protein
MFFFLKEMINIAREQKCLRTILLCTLKENVKEKWKMKGITFFTTHRENNVIVIIIC